MKFINVRVLCLAVFCLITLGVKGQSNSSQGGVISGALVDAATGKPLDFATVSLINKADNKPAKGLQTDMNGKFRITGINEGRYLLRATYVSYLTFIKDSIHITPSRHMVQLGAIKMRQAKGLLKEVVVTSARSQIKLSTDKKVFSVDQSLVSQGGSATDLLTNVPSVQVDVDGNVSLRGSSNVRVLINGKPSAISGNVSDVLQSIPANAIENVEVITNPSSKYDAEGQSGIINIVLKKNAQIGFNGSASATIGSQNTFNGNLNLAYQNSKVNLYANYGFRKADRQGNGTSNRISYPGTADAIYSNQFSDQVYSYHSHNIRSGIDLNLSPNTVLSVSDNINLGGRDRTQIGDTRISSHNILTQQTSQNNFSGRDGTNIDANIDFSHKFKKKGEELTANFGYSSEDENTGENLVSITNYNTTPATSRVFKQNNYTDAFERNLNLQADYTLPLTNGKLEAGYRSTFNRTDNNYRVDTLMNSTGQFVYNNNQSTHFIYNEQVHAAYANYQRQFGDFGVQIGARVEDAHIGTRLVDSVRRYKQDYLRVYPSIFLSDKLTDNQTLQLSYTRRVSRPRDRELRPFLDRSDPFNYQQGNPALKPEDTHSFELSYMNYLNALTLTSSLYYRFTNDNIQQIRVPLSATLTLSTYDNINTASNAGYELIAKLSPTNSFDITGNVNVYYRNIKGDPALFVESTSGYAFNTNLTANYKPVKQLGIQLRGDYQGREVVAQGYRKALYGLDGGMRYDITKTLNASVNARDIFNTRRYGTIVNNNLNHIPYTLESTRRYATRTVYFTLSYRFGKGGSDQKQKRNRNQNQDNNGGGGNPDEAGMGSGGGPNAKG